MRITLMRYQRGQDFFLPHLLAYLIRQTIFLIFCNRTDCLVATAILTHEWQSLNDIGRSASARAIPQELLQTSLDRLVDVGLATWHEPGMHYQLREHRFEPIIEYRLTL